MKRLHSIMDTNWAVPACFLCLLFAYHLIFGQFFPTINGTLGHDYAIVMPQLLDGFFWFTSNGIFEPFWHTPSFCGGQPVLGDYASFFYSTTQFLTFYTDPLTSIYATVLLFSSLGFWGCYLLLRHCFGVSTSAATLGGALFMFNGFFAHRMMVGHLIYHGMMLIPLIAWLLLRSSSTDSANSNLLKGISAGCLFTYGIYSGLISLILPCSIAILVIIFLHKFIGHPTPHLLQRSLIFMVLVVGLSATKIVATQSFLHNFPRSDYALPGIAGMANLLGVLFNALFISPADIAVKAEPLVANMQWYLDRHEWEFGITLIPLLIILMGVVAMLMRTRVVPPRVHTSKWIWLAPLILILALPLALNIYTPNWNAFLKQVPVIKSNSNLFRWFLIYIPFIIVVSALFFDEISTAKNMRIGMLVFALAGLILLNANKDHLFYRNQFYKPDTILKAWRSTNSNSAHAQIRTIGGYVDNYNNPQRSANGNDLIARGESQLACYNPVFGYQLEKFPVKSLHPGSVSEVSGGRFNLKNPACYLYPQENNCTPGDHFTVSQRAAAQNFAQYKPYEFKLSTSQKIANWLTCATLILLVLLFFFVASRRIMRIVKPQ